MLRAHLRLSEEYCTDLWVDRSIHEASFTECPLGSGTGVFWRHGDNQNAAPARNRGAQDTTEVVLQCAGCQ